MDGGSITSRTFFSFFFFPLVRIPYNKHRFFPLSLFSLFLFFSTWAVLTRARNLWVHHFFFAPSARRALSLWRKKAANSLSATDCNANLSSCSTGAPHNLTDFLSQTRHGTWWCTRCCVSPFFLLCFVRSITIKTEGPDKKIFKKVKKKIWINKWGMNVHLWLVFLLLYSDWFGVFCATSTLISTSNLTLSNMTRRRSELLPIFPSYNSARCSTNRLEQLTTAAFFLYVGGQ